MYRAPGISLLSAIVFTLFLSVGACGSDRNQGGFVPEADAEDPALNGADGGKGAVVSDGGGVFNDGSIDATQSCTPDAGGPGPVQRICLSATLNECDDHHDLVGFAPNGTSGNGFDDDCDGLVDEGCACPLPGVTKECFLVPATQTALGVPPGWCAQNSRGSLDCVRKNELGNEWSGQCRGAQPPFADDICAVGDFDCDGREQNSKARDCTCGPGDVQCPTAPLQTVPYPPPSNLPLKVDGASWFQNPASASQATNWKWTLLGGDCDNILPHPTFAMFKTADGKGTPVGTQNDTLGTNQKEHGIVANAPDVTTAFYPAFSLSGDYVVTGAFDLFGKHYACSQKIEVRAPGIRAEACWDTEAGQIDLDLHVARVDGFGSCPKQGWSYTCDKQDCFYDDCYGNATYPAWFSPSQPSACQGWGSQTTNGVCQNPRLDRDTNGVSGTCDYTVTNPNQIGDPSAGGGFCGPENINIDNPSDEAEFAVAVKYFAGNAASRAHVNVYCNGARVLTTGYNPVTGVNSPTLKTSAATFGGGGADTWKVALITAHVNGQALDCDVKPIPSSNPRPATDGTNANCVEVGSLDGSDAITYFTPGGGRPADANALCFH